MSANSSEIEVNGTFDEFRHEIYKILEEIAEQCQNKHFATQADASVIKLCDALTDAVNCGVPQLNFASGGIIFQIVTDNEATFWNFCATQLPAQERACYEILKQVENNNEDSKAVIRIAINDNTMQIHLFTWLPLEETLRRYYKPWSLLLDTASLLELPEIVSNLNGMFYKLTIDTKFIKSTVCADTIISEKTLEEVQESSELLQQMKVKNLSRSYNRNERRRQRRTIRKLKLLKFHRLKQTQNKRTENSRIENQQLQDLQIQNRQLQEIQTEELQTQNQQIPNQEIQNQQSQNNKMQNKETQTTGIQNQEIQEGRTEGQQTQDQVNDYFLHHFRTSSTPPFYVRNQSRDFIQNPFFYPNHNQDTYSIQYQNNDVIHNQYSYLHQYYGHYTNQYLQDLDQYYSHLPDQYSHYQNQFMTEHRNLHYNRSENMYMNRGTSLVMDLHSNQILNQYF